MNFSNGQVVVSKEIHHLMTEDKGFSSFVNQSLVRHFAGDWGVVPDEDRVANELALQDGDRLLSAYVSNGKRIWIITEADRSATTVLFPSEY